METFPSAELDSKSKYDGSDNEGRNVGYDPESQAVHGKFDGPPTSPP